LIQSLAEEGREHGIRANAILPSIIHTPANLEWASEEEAAKWPTREDVGKVIGDLIDQRSPVTGAVIPLYGKIPF
jgi:3-oxoacyl-[acyl-carrier protein] reductase